MADTVEVSFDKLLFNRHFEAMRVDFAIQSVGYSCRCEKFKYGGWVIHFATLKTFTYNFALRTSP